MGVPEAFLKAGATTAQEEVMALATDTALKVALLYVCTAISKSSIGKRKWLLDHIASLAGIALGRGKGGNDKNAGP